MRKFRRKVGKFTQSDKISSKSVEISPKWRNIAGKWGNFPEKCGNFAEKIDFSLKIDNFPTVRAQAEHRRSTGRSQAEHGQSTGKREARSAKKFAGDDDRRGGAKREGAKNFAHPPTP